MIKDQFDRWFGGTVPCCTILYPIFRQSWKNRSIDRSIDPGWAFKHQRHSLCGHEHLRSQCTKGLPLVGKVSKYVNSMKSFKNSIPWHPSNVWLIPNSLQKLLKKHPQKNRWRGQSCGSSEADSGRQGSRPNRFGAGFLEATNVHQSVPKSKLIIGARERWFEKFEVPLGFRSLKEWVSEILRCAGIHWHENHSQRRLWDLFKTSEGKIVSEAKLRLPFDINSFWVWIYQIISSHSKNSWVTSVGEWLDASGLPWFLCCVDDQSFAEPGPKWVSLIMGQKPANGSFLMGRFGKSEWKPPDFGVPYFQMNPFLCLFTLVGPLVNGGDEDPWLPATRIAKEGLRGFQQLVGGTLQYLGEGDLYQTPGSTGTCSTGHGRCCGRCCLSWPSSPGFFFGAGVLGLWGLAKPLGVGWTVRPAGTRRNYKNRRLTNLAMLLDVILCSLISLKIFLDRYNHSTRGSGSRTSLNHESLLSFEVSGLDGIPPAFYRTPAVSKPGHQGTWRLCEMSTKRRYRRPEVWSLNDKLWQLWQLCVVKKCNQCNLKDQWCGYSPLLGWITSTFMAVGCCLERSLQRRWPPRGRLDMTCWVLWAGGKIKGVRFIRYILCWWCLMWSLGGGFCGFCGFCTSWYWLVTTICWLRSTLPT